MKNYLRLFKDELKLGDLWTLIIGITILGNSFLMLPAIMVKDYKLFSTLTKIYTNHTILYQLALLFIGTGITFVPYFSIKIIHIRRFKNFSYVDEMYAKYVEFISDAKELYIYSGDLGFLTENEEQYKLIKQMGDKCSIIFDGVKSKDTSEELVKKIVCLRDSGVQLKKYNFGRNIVFRGQIRTTARGTVECLFQDKIDQKRYREIRINDQYISMKMLDAFNDEYQDGIDPFIKAIIFDLGGVYFDGDFNKDFLPFLRNRFGIRIKSIRINKLALDKKMLLGKCTIIDWLVKQTEVKLNENDIAEIENFWSTLWKPNSNIQNIVDVLKENYDVYAADNLDKENGNHYIDKGYLKKFCTPHFFSYELGILKPDEKFWNKICETLDLIPEQILVIDDHEKCVFEVKKLGFQTIKYSITTQDSNELKSELKNLSIAI